MTCEEAQELITALVDNELLAAERSSIEDHFRVCRNCAFAYEQELALKREVRLAAPSLRAPAYLRERILSDWRAFPERAEWRRGWRDLWPATGTFLRPALALALLVLLILPILYLMRPAEPIPLAALETHKKIVEGSVSFVKSKDQEGMRERLSRFVEGQFRPMEHHLSVANFKAAGWLVKEVRGRTVLVAIYEKNGALLSCHTFFGTEEAGIPTNAAVFFDPGKGIILYAFSSGRINGVMQREGEATCVLVSEMPMKDLLALARSKA